MVLTERRVRYVIEKSYATRNCSFCGISQRFSRRQYAGPGVRICERCVEEARLDLNPVARAAGGPLTPKALHQALDRVVVGQHEAKRTLCVAVYNHYKVIRANDALGAGATRAVKSNILLTGP